MLTRSAPRVLVIGGGMAGASLGYELAADHAVVLLEAEARPGQHSTGRSAALFLADYGPPAVREVSKASLPLFNELQRQLSTAPLLKPRGALLVATSEPAARSLETWMADSALEATTSARCAELCPVLDAGKVLHAAYDPAARDIDVIALHDGYLRGLRARGGDVVSSARVTSAVRGAAGWQVTTADGRQWSGDVVVNAAGAWGDPVWQSFGVAGHGLVPCRRTVALARTRTAVDPGWPIVGDAAETWYFKPEGDRILISPSDETPTAAADAKADPIDVATALERVNAVTRLGLRSVVTAWAGLRTFAADHLPVVGHHPEDASLFSFLGQGGIGIQAAPALARHAAELVRGSSESTHSDLFDFSPSRGALDPGRCLRRLL